MLLAAEEKETRTDRTNFSERVKAKIYARDRAICAFTGMNLWLLDEGAGGFYNVCGIDHIIPATKGGTSTAENGVATFAAYNYNKGDNNIGANLYLFFGGAPTYRFWQYHRRLPPEMAQMIFQNEHIEPSDYSFNQAIMNLVCGVSWLHMGSETKYKRDDDYYASSTLRKLETWRRGVNEDEVESFEARNLVPESLTPDQELLLSLREAKDTSRIKSLMKEVLPHHAANLELRLEFESACENWLMSDGDPDVFTSIEDKVTNPLVSAIVGEQIVHNMNMLINPFIDWDDPEAIAEAIKEGEDESGEVI